MILKARRKQGMVNALEVNKNYVIIKEKGPGVFVSAFVQKQGGTSDDCFVNLYIDGNEVVHMTLSGAENVGFANPNNSGLITIPAKDCLTIQFNEPLYYASELRIEFDSGSARNIAAVIAVAVLGSGCSYPA
jgi:hypothetical protein